MRFYLMPTLHVVKLRTVSRGRFVSTHKKPPMPAAIRTGTTRLCSPTGQPWSQCLFSERSTVPRCPLNWFKRLRVSFSSTPSLPYPTAHQPRHLSQLGKKKIGTFCKREDLLRKLWGREECILNDSQCS